jgi:hypothetical protein
VQLVISSITGEVLPISTFSHCRDKKYRGHSPNINRNCSFAFDGAAIAGRLEASPPAADSEATSAQKLLWTIIFDKFSSMSSEMSAVDECDDASRLQ